MALVPKSKQPSIKKWYSSDERARFHREVVDDARRMSRELATTPASDIAQEDLYKCRGIEPFLLGQEALHDLLERRRLHVNAIVHGQRICTTEQLALLSERGSRWARDAARNRARSFDDRQ